ncbi:MAG TPA: Ada metal-binding domain-containing protein [Pyrinomonadaceae bacterium]
MSAELFGFHLGMTAEQVKARVPQIVSSQTDDLGVSKTTINPDFDARIDKAAFAGVRTISLDFLDYRVSSLWLGYESSFKWQTVPDFVAGISQSLRLPDAWEPWKSRGSRIRCADFQMTVSMIAGGASFHLIDETSEQTISARREAKDQEAIAAEAEDENEIIADKQSKVYYSGACRSATVKEANRVLFKTKEEAEKAGYKPAKNCQ